VSSTIRAWWRDAAIYQIYPRSFADSDGDGVGDLGGVLERLDYLEWLGIDAVWLNPITPSPNEDWGYDVSDYCDVHPELGTLEMLDELVAKAGERGIRILLDIVPNHTSDRHPWFLDARSSRTARHRDWYVWSDGRNGGPPNNWRSVFGGPAWTLDERTGQHYLHNFLPGQPDLNWWNPEVRDAFDRILRFWFDRGIYGFRIDVAHGLVNDRLLRDDPPSEDGGDSRGLRPVYSMNRPEVHDVYRRWRRIAEEYDPPRLLVGETHVLDPAVMASYYGRNGDELQLAFNFAFVYAPFEAAALRTVVELTEAAVPPGEWPVWTLSNHDVVRFPTRWCDGDEAKSRCALLALMTLRGTPVLYYGDELALPEASVPEEARADRAGQPARDGARTPMPWSDEAGRGFTVAGAGPWLPFGPDGPTVAGQRADRDSTLNLCRDLLALRRARADLRTAPYASLETPAGVWAWARGERYAVAVNLGGEDAALDGLAGTVLIATDRERDGEQVASALALRPSEGVLLEALSP
jgi:alpha-glucosidase